MYQNFLRSEIIWRNPDGTIDDQLEIGYKYLAESYVSHVELTRPRSNKTSSSHNTLCHHLINSWQFNSGPVPGSCSLYLLVDFKLQSPFYRQVQAVVRIGVSLLENTYEQRA